METDLNEVISVPRRAVISVYSLTTINPTMKT
jgi:hypothetical protein